MGVGVLEGILWVWMWCVVTIEETARYLIVSSIRPAEGSDRVS